MNSAFIKKTNKQPYQQIRKSENTGKILQSTGNACEKDTIGFAFIPTCEFGD